MHIQQITQNIVQAALHSAAQGPAKSVQSPMQSLVRPDPASTGADIPAQPTDNSWSRFIQDKKVAYAFWGVIGTLALGILAYLGYRWYKSRQANAPSDKAIRAFREVVQENVIPADKTAQIAHSKIKQFLHSSEGKLETAGESFYAVLSKQLGTCLGYPISPEDLEKIAPIVQAELPETVKYSARAKTIADTYNVKIMLCSTQITSNQVTVSEHSSKADKYDIAESNGSTVHRVKVSDPAWNETSSANPQHTIKIAFDSVNYYPVLAKNTYIASSRAQSSTIMLVRDLVIENPLA